MNNKKELAHWGIKGMRWGHRRYQNKDGSLTSAGKKRYSKNDDVIDMEQDSSGVYVSKNKQKTSNSSSTALTVRNSSTSYSNSGTKTEKVKETVNKVKEKVKTSKEKPKVDAEKAKEAVNKVKEKVKVKVSKEKPKTEEEKVKAEEEKNKEKNKEKKTTKEEQPKQVKDVNKPDVDFAKISGVASTTAKGLGKANEANTAIARIKNRKQAQQEMSTMDNKQLREKIERLNLEQQYSNLTSSRMSKGHQYVKNTLDVAVPLVEVAASAAAIAAIFMKKK